MTSSTPLPPPTDEQMEALRMVLASAADRYETDPPVGEYLTALAEGLHIVYSLDGETLEPDGQWGLRADVLPVEEEVSDDG